MPDAIKLLCNNCYQPLEVVTYPEGVYVNPCKCSVGLSDEEVESLEESAYREGSNYGYDMGAEDLRYEFEGEIEQLKDEISKLEELNEDDKYNERIGVM